MKMAITLIKELNGFGIFHETNTIPTVVVSRSAKLTKEGVIDGTGVEGEVIIASMPITPDNSYDNVLSKMEEASLEAKEVDEQNEAAQAENDALVASLSN